MEPFDDSVLRHPICPPPKGRSHTSILHGATESYEGGVIMLGFFSPGCLESADLKPDSGSVRHVIMESFYDGVLCHPIYPPPKGRPHKDSWSVSHAIMEPFNNGVVRDSIYPPPKGRSHTNVWKVLTLNLNSGGVRHAITEPFYNVVLHDPICPPPKERPHTSILHGPTESYEGGLPGALGMQSRSPVRTAFYTFQAVHCQKGVSIR
ncbi:hypothetical protein B9Z19DRAFT_1133058 [Tuber borchii]|uniref:Uncharacterized protein n=1 Tax=Tuber borchii TaxID=42251 RepID=A0A2T6ZGF2_TUBBO|nr:hypothetical protein B9Z19DRAFT_1133058 [Tuber borchii]